MCITGHPLTGPKVAVPKQARWLAALEGRSPESLLSTYSEERQVVARNLIDFDKEWSSMMAKKPEEFEEF
jgi:hypothetical protein